MKKLHIAIVALLLVTAACSLISEENNKANIKLGEGLTDIDGNVYSTVIIGDQEWMAENLRVTRMSDGRELLSDTTLFSPQTIDTTSYVIYRRAIDGVPSAATLIADNYGYLYNWHVVGDPAGICPQGWRVPSQQDWAVLVDYVVSRGNKNEATNKRGAGSALKSSLVIDRTASTPPWTASDIPGWFTDETFAGRDFYGFNALPGGMQFGAGFTGLGVYGSWWTSSPLAGGNAYFQSMYYNRGSISLSGTSQNSGASIRCMR